VRNNGNRGRRVPGTVPALSKDLLRRGVWQAPFFGPDGEMVLLAVTRDSRLVGDPVIVPHGASRIAAADVMLDRLNSIDPVPELRVI
jgi:hypothetical protein